LHGVTAAYQREDSGHEQEHARRDRKQGAG
jgi:hypothetical protein